MIRKILGSKIYKIVDYIVRLMLLNILLILISSSLFIIVTTIKNDLPTYWYYILLIPTALTLFPLVVAVSDVIRSYVVDKNNGLFKDFFKSFGKYYLKSLIINLFLIVVILLLFNSFTYFNALKYEAPIYMINLVIVYFKDLSVIHYIKLALIMSFKELPKSLLMLLIAISSIVLSRLLTIYLILFSFSLVIYLNILITKKTYIQISSNLKENVDETNN